MCMTRAQISVPSTSADVTVPFLDLRTQYHAIQQEIQTAVLKVLEEGQYILGPEVAAFEQEFARYCGAEHAVATNSGASALHLALLAAGIQPGDEVITVPFTFLATASAIDYCGARPVFVDIDPLTFNMDPGQVERAITPKTKALLPVHLYGQPAEMDPLLDIAARHGLAVIEDAAQAHGAEYRGRRVGAIGTAGCFSFYPTKNLGAYGEGGMLVTNDAALAARVSILRNCGQDRKYHHVLKGYNYRLEGLQGAILRVKLRYLEQWTEARRQVAHWYNRELADSALQLPVAAPHIRHVYHTYTVRSKARESLREHLEAAGIQTAVHYGTPVHLQPAFADLGYGVGSFPEAERAAQQVMSLPMYPELSEEAVTRVAAACRAMAG